MLRSLHALDEQLRGGRRRNVQVRLLSEVFAVGDAAAGIPHGLAPWSAPRFERQADGFHHRDSGHHPRQGGKGEDGGDQLSLRPQEAAVEASRARPHQRDYAPSQSPGHLAGVVHRWDCAPEAHRLVPILASLAQSKEADRGALLTAAAADDNEPHDQALQASRADRHSRLPCLCRSGHPGRPVSLGQLPGQLPARAFARRGRHQALALAQRQRRELLRRRGP
mmetsp:Transcript_3400/g.12220  ORF Transcript_3400/g.12220 Transcript_3400/m.12220 type:complete len:223 (-) Transcript_3400:437-1105(-)